MAAGLAGVGGRNHVNEQGTLRMSYKTLCEGGEMKKFGFAMLVVFWASWVNATEATSEYLEAQSLVDSSTNVVRQFANEPESEWFKKTVKDAKALFIVPENFKGGFLIGGSGGSGVMVAQDQETGKWGYPAFYTMGTISLGFQIGAESSQIVLMIMTEKGMRKMLSTSVKLGGDVTMAMGPVGLGAKAATADILAFAKSKGAFAGVSLEGAVVNIRNSLNIAYYKKPVDPVEVILLNNAINPDADKLIEAVTRLTAQPDKEVLPDPLLL